MLGLGLALTPLTAWPSHVAQLAAECVALSLRLPTSTLSSQCVLYTWCVSCHACRVSSCSVKEDYEDSLLRALSRLYARWGDQSSIAFRKDLSLAYKQARHPLHHL